MINKIFKLIKLIDLIIVFYYFLEGLYLYPYFKEPVTDWRFWLTAINCIYMSVKIWRGEDII